MISIPEMCDNLVILNLHYFKRDSYISVICQASIYAGEGRKADAVAHLASARSQNTGTGILGIPKRKGSCTAVASFSLFRYHTFREKCRRMSCRMHISGNIDSGCADPHPAAKIPVSAKEKDRGVKL